VDEVACESLGSQRGISQEQDLHTSLACTGDGALG
jgi:hypothetical protein